MMVQYNFQWSYVILAQGKVFYIRPKNLTAIPREDFNLIFQSTFVEYFAKNDRLYGRLFPEKK
jgi:hypothetical protein